jgi:hypothetical protein
MEIQCRLSQLERQNRLLQLIVFVIAIMGAAAFTMGAGTFNQDRGELLNITKIQLVDDHGTQVAVIDAKGINYSNKGSMLAADAILGRASVAANPHPENKKKYVGMGITSDGRTVYFEMDNNGGVRHIVFTDDGLSENTF